MAAHKVAHATLTGPSVVKEILIGFSLGLVAGGLWKMHHWNEQRKTRAFYDLLEKDGKQKWTKPPICLDRENERAYWSLHRGNSKQQIFATQKISSNGHDVEACDWQTRDKICAFTKHYGSQLDCFSYKYIKLTLPPFELLHSTVIITSPKISRMATISGVSLSTPRILAKASDPSKVHTIASPPWLNNPWKRSNQFGAGRMYVRPVAAAPEKISEKVEESIKSAEEKCSEDPVSGECAAAWDEVEELSAAASHARDKKKDSDPLETFCKDNPETDECRTYDN